MMAMKDIMNQFAGGTTMHGLPRAIRAKSTTARVFWSIICVAAASMFFMQFIQLLKKYYSYPRKVVIEIVPVSVPFPGISLCNMRNLDNIVLNNLDRIFKEVNPDEPTTWANYTDDPFLNSYLHVVAKYFLMFKNNNDSQTMTQIFQTVLTRTTIATNIRRDLVQLAGVPFKEFVVTCKYGGHQCNMSRDFSQFFDSYYYNCFTYIAPAPMDPDSTLAEGLENGWSTIVLPGSGMLEQNEKIRMIPGSHEWHSPMASGEGVRVVIHPREAEPYPHTEGFDVPPGYSASFGVKARQNLRIGLPHGNCSDSNIFGDDGYSYRTISCQKKCVQEAVVNECGCKDIALPDSHLPPYVKYCSDDSNIPDHCRLTATKECYIALNDLFDRFVCARHTKDKVARNASAQRVCGCFPPCQEVSYDVTYSLSKWPTEGFDGEEAYIDIFNAENYPGRFTGPEDAEKYQLYGEYFDPSNRRTAMKNFARLNVYIADSNVLKTEETEDYSQSQLLSDIGGQLGLWVGVSVITLSEMVALIVDVVKFLATKHGPYSRGKTFSKEPEYAPTAQMPCHSCSSHCCSSHCHMNGEVSMAPLAPIEEGINIV